MTYAERKKTIARWSSRKCQAAYRRMLVGIPNTYPSEMGSGIYLGEAYRIHQLLAHRSGPRVIAQVARQAERKLDRLAKTIK